LGFAPIQKADFLPGIAAYGDSGHTTSIGRHHTARLKTAQAAKIVGGGFLRELEGRSIQTDAL